MSYRYHRKSFEDENERNHRKSFEDENERIIDELNQLKICSMKHNKHEIYNSWRNEIEDLYEILSKFTKEKDNLNMILYNQRTLHNKADLSYQPINNAKSFMSIRLADIKFDS